MYVRCNSIKRSIKFNWGIPLVKYCIGIVPCVQYAWFSACIIQFNENLTNEARAVQVGPKKEGLCVYNMNKPMRHLMSSLTEEFLKGPTSLFRVDCYGVLNDSPRNRTNDFPYPLLQSSAAIVPLFNLNLSLFQKHSVDFSMPAFHICGQRDTSGIVKFVTGRARLRS